MMNEIIEYFDCLYPNAKCELIYKNNFEFLIAVVLSAQTTDKKVNKVTEVLFERYDMYSLSKANVMDLEEILKPLGMASKKALYIKKIAIKLLNDYDGVIPNNRDELLKLDGVGRKTANLILSTLYNEPFFAVDTHVNRVTKRLGLAEENATILEVENEMYKLLPKKLLNKLHHQFVLFGRYQCKSIKPMCNKCKLKSICKYNKNESL